MRYTQQSNIFQNALIKEKFKEYEEKYSKEFLAFIKDEVSFLYRQECKNDNVSYVFFKEQLQCIEELCKILKMKITSKIYYDKYNNIEYIKIIKI